MHNLLTTTSTDLLCPGSTVGDPQFSHLFVVLESDRPDAGSARYCLSGVDVVMIGRGTLREAIKERRDGLTTLRIHIPSSSMSSTHARIVRVAKDWHIEDSGSRNGTFVAGDRIFRPTPLDTSIIEAGRTFFMLQGDIPTPIGTPAIADSMNLVRAPLGLSTILPKLARQNVVMQMIGGSNIPILILGDTGTGKELVARAIHEISGRHGAFVAVNCGALSANLVDSQLFGHAKGSFSGAVRDEIGFVRAADKGTLFLDEIAELPLSAQAMLLRVLQEQEVIPVGRVHPQKVDVRVVCATQRTLESNVESGLFRNDLMARLAGHTYRTANLKERMGEFGLILSSLLEQLVPNPEAIRFSPAASRLLLASPWPHNIRQLRHAVSFGLHLADGGEIDVHHLPSDLKSDSRPSLLPAADNKFMAAMSGEHQRLAAALLLHLRIENGNVTAVARNLGKAPTQIHRWLKKFGIDPATYRRP